MALNRRLLLKCKFEKEKESSKGLILASHYSWKIEKLQVNIDVKSLTLKTSARLIYQMSLTYRYINIHTQYRLNRVGINPEFIQLVTPNIIRQK